CTFYWVRQSSNPILSAKPFCIQLFTSSVRHTTEVSPRGSSHTVRRTRNSRTYSCREIARCEIVPQTIVDLPPSPECQLPKLDVAGSIPVSRSIFSAAYTHVSCTTVRHICS